MIPAATVLAVLRSAPAVFCESRPDARAIHLSNGERAALVSTIERLAGALRAMRREYDLATCHAQFSAIERADKILAELGE